MSYNIVRCYTDSWRKSRVIERGLTLEEVQAHCSDPETSSSTCTSAAKLRYTKKVGKWFDAYEEAK